MIIFHFSDHHLPLAQEVEVGNLIMKIQDRLHTKQLR